MAHVSSGTLVAEGLKKFYGNRLALKNLSFSLEAGRVLGFLGPNGAGKTTAIRILTTILEPDAGHFSVAGIRHDEPEKIRRKIGVLPESLGFPKQTTAYELLTYFGQLYGQTAQQAQTRSLALLDEVGLRQRAKSLIGTYSRGMRQRLGIARALINDPAVVFLDEPTLGLDPRGQQELLALVQRIARDRQAGVILCSHLLSEIEYVCDDVVILMAGQIIASGSVAEVVNQTRQNAIRLHVPVASVASAQTALVNSPQVVQVTPLNGMAGWLRVEFATSAEATQINNQLMEILIRAEIPVLGLEAEGGLQDVFLQLTDEATHD